MVTFLLSDEASFVTGSVYEINSGQTQQERTRFDWRWQGRARTSVRVQNATTPAERGLRLGDGA